ncbi:tyrosine--tRNA ligase [Candidatus Nomurabacteria bacterium]|jgi:tyrosyl-tRNA synthetase|nr:MAG: tyrosine--tRNA ligase [Candidatus Nomurabacteria bacterium]
MAKPTEKEIDELLSRGVGSFIDPEGSFKKKILETPEKVVIKFGVDPTRPDIHLGHAVVLRKLRKFQDMGCKVIFLIGDFTARIGDPTGKDKIRPEMDQKEVEINMQTYLDQVGNILTIDPELFSWIRNSDWFFGITDIAPSEDTAISLDVEDSEHKKMSVPFAPNSFIGKSVLFEKTRMQITHLHNTDNIVAITLRGLLWTLKHVTHARLIERDMFQKRIDDGRELYMHEMLYPVLQGIDSFALARIYTTCDLEIGGTDQTFNMLMGRDVMKANGQPEQAVLACDLLVGTDGKEKMSKSLDNYIAITDTPEDMYGKVMSIPDASIANYFELATFTPLNEIDEIKTKLTDTNLNPKDLKMRLAREIVAIYHGEQKANGAETFFINTFQKKEMPDHIPEHIVTRGTPLVDFLLDKGIIESKSEFARLVTQNAIKIVMGNGEKETIVTDPKMPIVESLVIRIGKHRFIKLVTD